MSAPVSAQGDAPREDAPRLVLDAAGLDDAEVAAITTVVLAAAAGRAAPTPEEGAAAWRRAGLAEAVTGRRIRTVTQLERAPVR